MIPNQPIRLTMQLIALFGFLTNTSLNLPVHNSVLAAEQSSLATHENFIVEVQSPIHHQQQTLLTIENPSNIAIETIRLDASAIGGSAEMVISPDLMTLSLAVSHSILPGIYNLPLTILDEAGQEWLSEVEIEVLPYIAVEDAVDWDEEIIYFMLTDRFYDGDQQNNNPYDLDYHSADNPRGTYQGGDFSGVTEKLDYLSELGITTIWISPIVANITYDVSHGSNDGAFYGYHGYWAQDFEELNPHLGSIIEFHQLIDTAEEHNISVMVDVVLNHTGYGLHPNDGQLENQPPGYPSDSDRELYSDMIRLTPGNNQLTESLSGLPDLLTEDPMVRQQIVDWQTAWIDMATTEKGNSISSYRVDTVIHVDPVTLQHFRNQLTTLDPEFKLIGEAWGAEPTNSKGFLNSGMLDSVLDFKFKDIARQFINGNMVGANQQLVRRNQRMTSSATAGQFLSSHDETGFLYLLNGDVGKFKVAVSLQMTAKGQPVIYYGEELGQTGANNWPLYDNRYNFAWEQVEDNDTLEHYQRLINFRHEFSKLLSRGERNLIAGNNEEKWLMVERSYEEDSVYIAFNLSDEAQTITLPVTNAAVTVRDYYFETEFEAMLNEASEPVIEFTLPAKDDGGTLLLKLIGGEIIPETLGELESID